MLVSGPAHGTLTLNSQRQLHLHAGRELQRPRLFSYKANDGQADSNVATVALTVTAVNDAPVAVANSYSTNEDTQLTVNTPAYWVTTRISTAAR